MNSTGRGVGQNVQPADKRAQRRRRRRRVGEEGMGPRLGLAADAMRWRAAVAGAVGPVAGGRKEMERRGSGGRCGPDAIGARASVVWCGVQAKGREVER
jgi:hypothetical protein